MKDVKSFIRDMAIEDRQAGLPVNNYDEFAGLLEDEGIAPTDELYQYYLEVGGWS